ncbi:MAG: hypothetical protein KDA84_30350, partial [Planctomycetaceae bacterium]|nr:hypothetical protein [Planctomycetaceae bacterium]
QLRLANWCRDQKLYAQEHAHLITALELSGNPNNVEIRSRLGHQFVDGMWMSRYDIAESLEQAHRFKAAAKIWNSKLRLLSRQLSSPRADLQQQAREEFLAIDDPDVLPVLEEMFSRESVKSAQLLLELLSKMNVVEANQYLARQAVLSPYVTVREEAAKTLRSRPPETYAPLLLDAMHTPIQSRVRLFVGSRGVQLSHFLSRDTKDVREIARHNSRVVFRNIPVTTIAIPTAGSHLRRSFRLGLNGSYAAQIQLRGNQHEVENEVLQKQLQAHAQQRAVEQKNDRLEEWNDRVIDVLKTATELDLPNNPEDWWAWWNEYNHLVPTSAKPIKYREVTNTRTKVTHFPRLVRLSSCLTEGTPIWTDRGFVAVEKIRIGDRVLSQHPRTGELAYQPVLRTTIRPATSLITAQFGSSHVTCTEGHTFWVSGKGWQKMRDIATGSPFHSVKGFVTLESRQPAEPEPTYNLVVAGFHTYFVGPDMLLSQDVTFAEPVNNMVPGLHREFKKP